MESHKKITVGESNPKVREKIGQGIAGESQCKVMSKIIIIIIKALLRAQESHR